MKIDFIKMHGLGNDYIYVDCFRQSLRGIDLPELCRTMSDRHHGIGADGLILITPPSDGVGADVRMEMYNADGSRGEMCGNGIRCVAKYAVENGLARAQQEAQATQVPLLVETDRGVLQLAAHHDPDGIVSSVRVDMGSPILQPRMIPVDLPGDRCVRSQIELAGRPYAMTCVSMGNPHAVFFVDDLGSIDLATLGPSVERHRLFPNRVNAHFAQANSRRDATMRTWERGTGITLACGTGACAVHVAGVLEGRLDRRAAIHLPGGDLEIDWPEGEGTSLFKTGPAEEVFRGTWSRA